MGTKSFEPIDEVWKKSSEQCLLLYVMIKTAPLSNRRITSWLAPIAERERFVKTLTLVRIKIYIYIIWLTFYAAYSSNVPVKRMVAIVACQGVLNVNIRSPLKEEVRGGPKPH